MVFEIVVLEFAPIFEAYSLSTRQLSLMIGKKYIIGVIRGEEMDSTVSWMLEGRRALP